LKPRKNKENNLKFEITKNSRKPPKKNPKRKYIMMILFPSLQVMKITKKNSNLKLRNNEPLKKNPKREFIMILFPSL
jgi:hypothetical protein